MKEPPFNIAMLLFGVFLAVFVAGAVVAEVLSALGVPVFLTALGSAFLPFLLGGAVRSLLGRLLASSEGTAGRQPAAFSFTTRLLIGAALSLLVAASYAGAGVERLDAALGGFAALVVVSTLSAVFLFTVMVFTPTHSDDDR